MTDGKEELNNNNPERVVGNNNSGKSQEKDIQILLDELEKITPADSIEDLLRLDKPDSPKQEVVDEMIKKEQVILTGTGHPVQTQVSDTSSTSTYPEVFPPSPQSPLDVRAIPFPKPTQSVDSPQPRSTVSSFKPSVNSITSRPDSLEFPPPPSPRSLKKSMEELPDLPDKPPKSPISPGAFSYTKGMLPNVLGSPKFQRSHSTGSSPGQQSPSHEEAYPKMGVPQRSIGSMWSAAPER